MRDAKLRETMVALYRLVEKYEDQPPEMAAVDWFSQAIADAERLYYDAPDEMGREMSLAFLTALSDKWSRLNGGKANDI